MIRRHGVAKHCEHTRAADVLNRRCPPRHLFEKRRTFDVRGIGIPLEKLAGWRFDSFPSPITLERFLVCFDEHLGADRRVDGAHDFPLRRPHVAKVDRLSAFVLTKRLGADIDIHLAGQRVRDDERRRSQIVGAHQRIDSPFKIAVAAENRSHNQPVVFYRRCDGIGKRSAVSDTRRTAVAHQVEAQAFQVGH